MWRFCAVLALIAVLVSGCGLSDEYLLGRDLYERSCAACHGVDGNGTIGPEIGQGSNTELNLTAEQIAGVITVGPGNMPGFSRFTPAQVASLVDYVRAMSVRAVSVRSMNG
jgi:mono/diheme cytochrome c family protein